MEVQRAGDIAQAKTLTVYLEDEDLKVPIPCGVYQESTVTMFASGVRHGAYLKQHYSDTVKVPTSGLEKKLFTSRVCQKLLQVTPYKVCPVRKQLADRRCSDLTNAYSRCICIRRVVHVVQ